MGILMANGRLTESQAFDQLRTVSHTGVNLTVIAHVLGLEADNATIYDRNQNLRTDNRAPGTPSSPPTTIGMPVLRRRWNAPSPPNAPRTPRAVAEATGRKSAARSPTPRDKIDYARLFKDKSVVSLGQISSGSVERVWLGEVRYRRSKSGIQGWVSLTALMDVHRARPSAGARGTAHAVADHPRWSRA
jgi:hypothetical protein